ncbi:hypothetical protein ABTC85_15780 [Acinetobacter baumannii]|uniref:Uncharacterized protein n=1 Tax=Acinetobacter baumannii TaxID=470 RepID=A0A0C4Y2V2_ACIBA|nr:MULTISPECIES: hypothetical protein [Acinetobacter calcoaceticus/baumannii complex]AFI97454.1 hypothetical protein ABTJ_p0076 [Acinetobacter baumannii MDR-TJ]AGQ12346.1 hypothetical protein BJAB0868_p0089 [Acinetobacter baumannii BJAB0868]AGQ16207.1 hypothetical protein BJAB07104_p0079 [Acinetobacter baumannii BJAB07104]AJF79924.1 hypothetical protein NG19_0088 [Acinetobacter baumannii]APF45752.1 hypothetical protein BKJ37_19660 [Acinetobacter baumannii]
MKNEYSDSELEKLWCELSKIAIAVNENFIEQDFIFFEAGTDIIEIWIWFDQLHSKGVKWLQDNID